MIKVGQLFRFKEEGIRRHFPETFMIEKIDTDGDIWIKSSRGFSIKCNILCDSDIELVETFKIENNMERNLKMSIEQAQKIYKEQPSMRELLLTTFTKEELEGVVLKNWSELGGISGYFIESDSEICTYKVKRGNPESHCKNTFATMKQAKSALAMAQLSQLMKDLGDECDVDWMDDDKNKYTILRHGNSLTFPTITSNNYAFIAFKTAGICCSFVKKHERLIKDYFMIY